MTLNGVMPLHCVVSLNLLNLCFNTTTSICGRIYAQVYSVVRVRCCHKESSRSLSHLLTSCNMENSLAIRKLGGYTAAVINTQLVCCILCKFAELPAAIHRTLMSVLTFIQKS